MPAALVEAFRILERTRNPGGDVIVLTDGQRFAWRPGETGPMGDGPRPPPPAARSRRPLWSIAFGGGEIGRHAQWLGRSAERLAHPGHAGPAADGDDDRRERRSRPLVRTAELLDRRPPGRRLGARSSGRSRRAAAHRSSFRTSLTDARLAPADRPARRRRCAPRRRRVGHPDRGRAGGPRAPGRRRAGPRSPSAARPTSSAPPWPRPATTRRRSAPGRVTPAQLTADALQRSDASSVLANVDRLTSAQIAALGTFVDAGGGLLIAPGDRTDAPSLNAIGWMPARLGDRKGDAGHRADDRPPRRRGRSPGRS